MRLFGRWQAALLGAAGALAAACTVVLPIAPRMGFALQSNVCDSFGACQTAALMTDSCSADTRSGVGGQAATPVYFEEVAKDRVALQYFADGTAGVVADDGEGLGSHRFADAQDALRWLVARNPSESAAIDRAWGPAAAGQADAVLAGAQALGLNARTVAADTSTLVPVQSGDESAVMTIAGDGSYTVHQTMTLPWQASARLTGMVTWLGQQSHLVLQTDYTSTGSPESVTLTGPARRDWDLRVLSGTSPTTGRSMPDPPQTDEFGLRSYTLDLTRQQNAAVFNEVFPARYGADGRTFAAPPADPYPTEGDESGRATEHPVETFANRVRADAVLVESTYEGSTADAQPLTPELVLALLTGMPADGDASGFSPRLSEASAVDLARPESSLSPIVNCEVLTEDDLQRIVDEAEVDGDE